MDNYCYPFILYSMQIIYKLSEYDICEFNWQLPYSMGFLLNCIIEIVQLIRILFVVHIYF